MADFLAWGRSGMHRSARNGETRTAAAVIEYRVASSTLALRWGELFIARFGGPGRPEPAAPRSRDVLSHWAARHRRCNPAPSPTTPRRPRERPPVDRPRTSLPRT